MPTRTRRRIIPPKPDADEKAPSSGAFLPASLMYFCSGEPMHVLSGVDICRNVKRCATHGWPCDGLEPQCASAPGGTAPPSMASGIGPIGLTGDFDIASSDLSVLVILLDVPGRTLRNAPSTNRYRVQVLSICSRVDWPFETVPQSVPVIVSISPKYWSEWQDLNLRPPRPERGRTPDDP